MMEYKILPDNFDSKEWDKIASHVVQSWEWGQARKKMGLEILRIGVYENSKLVDGYQMSLHRIPKTKFNVGYLPNSLFPNKELLDFLSSNLKSKNLIFIKFEPNVLKENIDKVNIDIRLLKSAHPLFSEWNPTIDLTKSEEQLLKDMKSKTRYNVRLAQKKGLVVKESFEDKDFEAFLDLYFETCKRQNYFGHGREYHRTIWNSLKGDIARTLTVYYNDIPLAAYELFLFNDVLYYPYGGSSELHRNLMPANLLMWEAILLGKKLGARKFDMWGALPPGANAYDESWAGFTRFKMGFGPSFDELVGSYDFVMKPMLYKAYAVAYKLRRIYLKNR